VLTKRCYISHTSRQLALTKHNELRQDSYLAAMLAVCIFINKQTRWTMKHASAVTAKTKASSLIRLITIHSKITAAIW